MGTWMTLFLQNCAEDNVIVETNVHVHVPHCKHTCTLTWRGWRLGCAYKIVQRTMWSLIEANVHLHVHVHVPHCKHTLTSRGWRLGLAYKIACAEDNVIVEANVHVDVPHCKHTLTWRGWRLRCAYKIVQRAMWSLKLMYHTVRIHLPGGEDLGCAHGKELKGH